MREKVVKVIDGKSYVFHQLSPRVSARIFVKVVKIVGPSIAKVGGELFDQQVDKLAPIIAVLSERLDEKEVEEIFEAMFTISFFGQAAVHFDHLNFQGETLHMFKVVAEALKANYADFFDGKSAALLAGVAGLTPESSTSMASSGGPS